MGQITVDLSEKLKDLSRENSSAGKHQECHFLVTLLPGWMLAKLPMTKSRGRPARLPSETTKARPFSSSATSKFRPIGPKPRPTLWPASIFMAKWAPRSANIAWPNWCTAWSTPSPIGAARMDTFPFRRRRRGFPVRTRAPDAASEGVLQLAGLVQRGRSGIARLRLVLRCRVEIESSR